MIPYPNIDPDLISIGPIRIRWYGIMYVLGFLASYLLITRQKRSREIGLVGNTAQDLIFYAAMGLIIGARLGYIIFYQYHDYAYYLKHPLEIIATWHGGMSFHGGLIGAVLAGLIFTRRRGLPFLAVADSTIVTAPIGLGLGRIGNFINAEILGRPSDVPWAMIFPGGGPMPRHPVQLYESLGEGFILFAILWTLRKRNFRDGMMVVFFLVFYGIIRFIIEFFREPDVQIGFILQYITMGQILCMGMIIAGVLIAFLIRWREPARETVSGSDRRSSK
jgi:phosphatidylglycerol:prolipoprotein diacylglycerol transferase